MSSQRFSSSAALCLLATAALGCPSKPKADKEPPPPTPPPSAAAVAPGPSGTAAPAVKTIPTYIAEKFAPPGTKPEKLYAVEGALAVSEGQRVGVIVDDGITWVSSIPKGSVALGDNVLTDVKGRHPDLLAALYTSGNGRAPQPTYYPLTGKAGSFMVAEGGGWGDINGVVRVGETVFLAINSMMTGAKLVPVRGPKLVRHSHTPAEAGCKEGEVRKDDYLPAAPAIVPAVLESSPAGTMMSLGKLCEKRGPAAEIWDKDGKPKIVDLGRWWKDMSYRPTILKGAGDELWAYAGTLTPIILHYKDGEIEPLPALDWPIDLVFASPQGQLHVSAGKVVYRYEGGQWLPIGRLPKEQSLRNLVLDDKGTLWASVADVYKLRPGPAEPFSAECATHFVYLYPASWKNGKDYTYPTTRKALSTFPEASAINLVEYGPQYGRSIGVVVTSKAQGEALVAHIKATMKDENPHYVCDAPSNVRKIPLDAKP
ncbi:MAG: hypothetical protein QM820_57005 [Minicystis sp.]